jgi:pimeloyl-ACP methyl ester carboxylesterase
MGFETFTLCLRMEPEGGDIDFLPNLDDLRRLTSRRVVLLIHGYNNTFADAKEEYQAFFDVQLGITRLGKGADISPDRNFIKIFWPGDAWGLLGFSYYPWAIRKAQMAAKVLAEALTSQVLGLEVQIVGHSLGCRLAFELMKQLNDRPGVRLSKVVLMAAAVPTFMLEDLTNPGSLHNAYEKAHLEGALSLFSDSDLVLSAAFPIGQTIAPGSEGVFPTALGHERWSSPNVIDDLKQVENHGSGHSDYWGQKRDTREKYGVPAGVAVHQFLTFSSLAYRQCPTISTPQREPNLLMSVLSRSILDRDTLERVA